MQLRAHLAIDRHGKCACVCVCVWCSVCNPGFLFHNTTLRVRVCVLRCRFCRLSPTIFNEEKDGKDKNGKKLKIKRIPAVELDDLIHQVVSRDFRTESERAEGERL